MSLPRDIPVIDTLIGFRDTHQMGVASTRGDRQRHPAEYMFKDIPEELAKPEDRFESIAETIAQMDAHNIRIGLIHMSDDRTPEALRRHPERFAALQTVDPNLGMAAIRRIQHAYDEHGIKGVSFFPSGQQPPVPIDHRLAYPIYANALS